MEKERVLSASESIVKAKIETDYALILVNRVYNQSNDDKNKSVRIRES